MSIHSSVESLIDAFILHSTSQVLNTINPLIWFAEVISGKGDFV